MDFKLDTLSDESPPSQHIDIAELTPKQQIPVFVNIALQCEYLLFTKRELATCAGRL